MRVVAVIVELAASGLTKIPVSDQVCFLSNRFTAQWRPQKPIVPKNRVGRERNKYGKRRLPHAAQNRAVFASLHLRRACRSPTVLASSLGRLGSSVPRICRHKFSAGRDCIDGQQNVGSSCSGHAKREVKKAWHKKTEPVYMSGRWGWRLDQRNLASRRLTECPGNSR